MLQIAARVNISGRAIGSERFERLLMSLDLCFDLGGVETGSLLFLEHEKRFLPYSHRGRGWHNRERCFARGRSQFHGGFGISLDHRDHERLDRS